METEAIIDAQNKNDPYTRTEYVIPLFRYLRLLKAW